MQENPLKAEVRSEDEEQRINVVVKQSTTFKRTLLQVTGGRRQRCWVPVLGGRGGVGRAADHAGARAGAALVSALPGTCNLWQSWHAPGHVKAETQCTHPRCLLGLPLLAPCFLSFLLPGADITMLGDSRSVAKLLLPAGARVLDVEQLTVEQPPRDTGTVLGVIQREPVNYYR